MSLLRPGVTELHQLFTATRVVGEYITWANLKVEQIQFVVLYLSNKLWMTSVCDVELSDVSVQPVTEVHEAIIQGQQDIGPRHTIQILI